MGSNLSELRRGITLKLWLPAAITDCRFLQNSQNLSVSHVGVYQQEGGAEKHQRRGKVCAEESAAFTGLLCRNEDGFNRAKIERSWEKTSL